MHGYLSSKEAFASQTAYFAKHYRVTALDFLGQGQSGELKTAFSVADYAEWTAQVLAALGVCSPVVVAHSFGCRVIIKMVALGLIAPTKIILTGPAGVVLPRGAIYRLKVGVYRLVRRVAPRFAESHFGSKEYRTLSPVMRESYKKIVNEDLRGDAEKVACPVLILEGREDRVTPMREAEAYLKVMQNARLSVLEGGHFAFAEHPVAFNILVEEFLQDD